MLAVWRDWGLDLILKDAYDRGVVMSGVSAGAICWFEGGLTDSWASDLKMMECMNFIPEIALHIMMKSLKDVQQQSNFLKINPLILCMVLKEVLPFIL